MQVLVSGKDNRQLSAFDARMFLTHNADAVIHGARSRAMAEMACGQCPTESLTMLPEQSMQTCDARTCRFGTYEPDGLGTGRDYFRSRNAEAVFAAEGAFSSAAPGGTSPACKSQDTLPMLPYADYRHSAVVGSTTMPH
jgi:Zn ribbon nucleic-acid-binding protein